MQSPDLGKMIGPLPLGAWIAVVGGSVGLMIYVRAHPSSPAVDDPSVNTSGYQDVGTGGLGNGGSGGGGSPVGNTPSTPAVAEDNEAWMHRVYSAFTAANPAYDAYQVSVALSKYLAGQGLTAWEMTVITMILARYGLPPQTPPPPWFGTGSSGGGVVPNPAPAPVPTPAQPSPTPQPQPGKPTTPSTGGGTASAASGLRILHIADTHATVTWNNSPNASGYNVYLNSTKYRANVPRANPITGDARCHFDGLKKNTSYTVRVVSRNGNGSEGASTSITIHTTK